MTFFKKTEAKTVANKQNTEKLRELSASEMVAVSGGINPQPLPPCRASKQM